MASGLRCLIQAAKWERSPPVGLGEKFPGSVRKRVMGQESRRPGAASPLFQLLVQKADDAAFAHGLEFEHGQAHRSIMMVGGTVQLGLAFGRSDHRRRKQPPVPFDLEAGIGQAAGRDQNPDDPATIKNLLQAPS